VDDYMPVYSVQNGVDVESQDELDRTVGLEIRVSPLPLDFPLEDAPSQKLLSQAEAVQQRLHDLKNHYDYMRTREAVHRATTEETFSRVVRWSILE
jgi:hypothetical protein